MLVANRIKEYCTVIGTGDVTLIGAINAVHRPFNSAFNDVECFYVIINPSANEFEVGKGTYNTSPNNITRNSVYLSSNANALVSFTAGTKYIYNDVPAEFFNLYAAPNTVPISGDDGKIDTSWLPESGPGSGNVTGPDPSTEDAIAAYADATGTLLRNTEVIIHADANDKLETKATFAGWGQVEGGAVVTLDFDEADKWLIYPDQDFSLVFDNVSIGQRLTIAIDYVHEATSLLWPDNILWHNDTPPQVVWHNETNQPRLIVELVAFFSDAYSQIHFRELCRHIQNEAQQLKRRHVAPIVNDEVPIYPDDDIVIITFGATDPFDVLMLDPSEHFNNVEVDPSVSWRTKIVTLINQDDAAVGTVLLDTGGSETETLSPGMTMVLFANLETNQWEVLHKYLNSSVDDVAGTGLLVRTSTGYATRTLTLGSALSGSDLDGVAGNPTFNVADVITAGGPTGSASTVPVITYNAKGQLTTVSSATITGEALTLSDVTTNNVSTSKHGFFPKLDGTATHFIDMTGVQRALAASDLGTTMQPQFGYIGVGLAPLTTQALRLGSTLTGSTTLISCIISTLGDSGGTASLNGFLSTLTTATASYTVTDLKNFSAGANVQGSGSTITNNMGYDCAPQTIGSTLNLGYRSRVASSATGGWNFYGTGTAPSHFGHNVCLGGTVVPTNATFALILGGGGSTTPVDPSAATDICTIYVKDAVAGKRQIFATNESGVVHRITGNTCHVASNFSKTNNTLANITGLTRDVVAGEILAIEAVLFTTSDVAAGVKAAIGGTATATLLIAEAEVVNAGVFTAPGTSRVTALATTFGDVTAVTVAKIHIQGYIEVNAAGTLTIQFAQNATNAAASLVLAGSWMRITSVGA